MASSELLLYYEYAPPKHEVNKTRCEEMCNR
jgi:hypothetical protein